MASSAVAGGDGGGGQSAAWPLSLRAQVVAGVVMAFTNFMVILDLTIVNVSVPHISGNLGISLDQGAWLITSYAVAEAICVPLTGWLTDRFGSIRVYVACLIGFGLFSLVCGLSLNVGMLVAARVGQGFAGAPLMPITQAMLLRVFPPARRNVAMSAWSMTVLVAPAMGPILGGWITDNFSWHWIFFINLPICAFCVMIGGVVLRPIETQILRRSIDAVGMALLVFWVGCLQIMVDIGRDHDWFADWRILALGISALVGCLVFLVWELTEEYPVVNLRIFRHRTFAIAVAAVSLNYSAYFSTVVVIPQWLQTTQGYTALDAGLLLACTAITTIAMSMFVPRLCDRFDLRLLITIGSLWFAMLCFVRTGWISGMAFGTMAIPQLLQGFGVSLYMTPLIQMSLGSVRPDEVRAAAGLQNFTRTICLAVSTSLVLNDWGNQQRADTNAIVDALRPDATVGSLADAGITLEYGRNLLAGVVNQQAVTVAMDHLFLIASIIPLFAVSLVWLSRRPRPLKQMQAEH